MEASKLLGRSFRVAVSRCGVCECQSASISRIPIAHPPRQRSLPHRPFSSSTQRRQDTKAEPPNNASKPSATAAPSPPTPKQELRQYTNSLQKIIDGYNLKSRLPPRQHESLVVALTNAEVRLDAPGAHPDSFAPLLKTLRGEVEPVLKINLGSSDTQKLIAHVGKQNEIPIPKEPPKDSPPSLAQKFQEKKPQGSISSRLDAVMGTQKPSTPPPKPERPADDGGTRSTLDNVFEYYMQKSSREREAASLLKPDPKTTRERELSLNLQEQLGSSDAAWINRNKQEIVRPALRLKPSLGRTVNVSGNFDVTRAFRTLEAACNRNNIKRDVHKQRFHVRRGQLKKQLKSERWRKLFKEGFLAECNRVRRMRRQGW